ncbi:MAG TPA: chemotaxis protein CheA [Gammaproteobacteria bacterium]|nr:chemotaxis protein CheA [Gammaproteobacteria bacterium]
MDELLKQFVIESRELVDKAVEDLLALEKAPNDSHRFEDVFRAFHTLKGGAGIVEFGAMQQALHGAEDALAAARAESRPVSAPDVGNCLSCLDQVVEWLDAIERGGAIPIDADSADIVALFARAGAAKRAAGTVPSTARNGWQAELLDAHRAVAARARTALRYTPATDSFFRQHDPLAQIAELQGLLAVGLALREPSPQLEDLDPFSCNLTITALVAASPPDVTAALADEARHCEIAEVSKQPRAPGGESVARKGRELLEAQLRLLETTKERRQQGRVASAGLVATNVLRHLGRRAEADAVATAAAVAIAEDRLEPLAEAIGAALNPVPSAGAAEPRRAQGSQTIRVSSERIDALVRLTGELIVAKNALQHSVKLADQATAFGVTLKNQHAALERLVNELQRAVVGIRVLPLRAAFQRFPRLVREMSAELQKPATLVIEGEDTEADKAIVEALVEPLVHVLRNAVDHGVEDAAARAEAGKPAVATIRLTAARKGEHVVIEVTDDGRGIDVARVKQVARERELVAPEAVVAMSDEEALDLIFLPGFSTADTVTQLSGRGVGMDAVRTAVSRLGGQVEVRTALGTGTTVRVTLPFSVLVTEVMTVEAGGQVFGIPLDAVVETLRVEDGGIFPIGAAHAIVVRDRTIPLIRLADLLGGAPARGKGSGPIVIAQLEGELGAVQVDRIGERMDIILKPLDGLLTGSRGLAGSALLGDGSVLLVLDLGEFVQ